MLLKSAETVVAHLNSFKINLTKENVFFTVAIDASV